MQGTIVMLMALSGLGCHHKSCDVAFAPSCYTDGACYGGFYGDCYSTIVAPSCYSSCFSSGYSGCYNVGYCDVFDCYGGYGYDGCGYGGCGGYRGCGLLRALFSCFGWGRHHRYCDPCCDDYGLYSTAYCDYGPAVFGSGMPIYETPMSGGYEAVETAPHGTPVPGPAPGPSAKPPTAAPPTPTQPEETTTPPPTPSPPPSAGTPPAPPTPAPPPPPAGESVTPKPPTPAIEKPRL